jgi:hypothetical protein
MITDSAALDTHRTPAKTYQPVRCPGLNPAGDFIAPFLGTAHATTFVCVQTLVHAHYTSGMLHATSLCNPDKYFDIGKR